MASNNAKTTPQPNVGWQQHKMQQQNFQQQKVQPTISQQQQRFQQQAQLRMQQQRIQQARTRPTQMSGGLNGQQQFQIRPGPQQQQQLRPGLQQQQTRPGVQQQNQQYQQYRLPQSYQQQPPQSYQSPTRQQQQQYPPPQQSSVAAAAAPAAAAAGAGGAEEEKIEVVHPDMMQINSELHSQLETLQEELTKTRQAKNKAEETVREMEAEGGVRQTEEVKKLKTALQEMGRVVKYLETELQRAQEFSNSDTKELATKLMQEREKNQEMEQKISTLEQSSLQGKNEDSIMQVKTAAQNTVAEKDKVIQEMMDKLKRSEESLQSQSVNVEVQKSTIRHLEEKCGKLQQSTNQGELIKKYEGNLRSAQMQINKLQQCLQVATSKDREGILQKFNSSQNQVTNLLTTLKNNEARWKSQEEAVSRQFNEKIKYAQDNVSKLQVALEEKNKLELWNLEKIRTLEESLVLKETIIVKQEEKLATVSQIELSVKNLEDELTELNTKLKMSEEENKKLREEMALKEIAVKEGFLRMEAQLTLADQTKVAIENKKLEVDKHVRDLETKYAEVEEELEDTKQRLSEMEADCAEAVQKYKDLHEQKIVSDSNFEKCQQDCDQLKKSYDEEVHKYSMAIGIKSRYEYQINLLEEKCRNIGDISVKLKELKDQFGELQIEKNNVQDQLKEAADKEKLYIETVSCKDAEIVSLNKVLESKNQSSDEIVLQKESQDVNSVVNVEAVKKEMCEKETYYQQELDKLQLENVKIKEQLVSLSVNQELNGQNDDEKTNHDLITKYKMDLAETTIQMEALKAENIEMNRKLNELIVKDKDTEALKLELANVRLKLKEFENMSMKSDERMFVESEDNADQEEILKTLRSMSINKRKRVLENLYEENKKGRFDESVEENMESVCNTEQVNGQAKNDLVTDLEARRDECDQSKDNVSQSVESLLVSSPVPEVKPPRNTNPGKPAAILFCNWAKADDDADGEESESESSEGFSEDSDNDSPETRESLEPTLEDTVA